MEWAPFARAMDTLTSLRGPDLLRVKGFIEVAGCRGPVLVQFVQHLADPPVGAPPGPTENATTRLVFITPNLPEAAVRNLFAAVQTVAGPHDYGSSECTLSFRDAPEARARNPLRRSRGYGFRLAELKLAP